MKHWLIAPLATLLLGAAPSQDPSAGTISGGTAPSSPTIEGCTCTPTPDTLIPGGADETTVVCDCDHNGYAGNYRFAIACSDGLDADEFTGTSEISSGQTIDRDTLRYTTTGCKVGNYDSPGAKTVTWALYPGNAAVTRVCTGGELPAGETCGLGFELVVLIPLLARLHRRRGTRC